MSAPTLGYLGLHTEDLDDWRLLAEETFGAEVVDGDASLDIRLDRHAWRVRVRRAVGNDLDFAGWAFADNEALESAADRLRDLGHDITPATPAERESRQVQALYLTRDPDGNAVELHHSPLLREPATSRHHVGFETDLGLGHLVLWCRDLTAMLDFYCSGLGLRITDTIEESGAVIHFLRANERHHSLALVPTTRTDATVQHLMFEVDTVDAVGAAYERACSRDVAQTSMGRHSNDEMFSFYAMAPGGYTIEYGWGGRLVDERTHQSAHYAVTSWWGHRTLKESR